MSLPVFKDFDKATRDIFGDDFDTKNTLKVKSAAPGDVTLTTNTDCSAFTSKVSAKWAHASGFSVDKLEFAGKDQVKLETSLTGLAPGMKLDFKGASAGSGVLGMTYKHKLATFATDVDVAGFSALNASVVGGSKSIQAGASVNCALSKFEVKDFAVALGYAPNSDLYAGVVANKKLSEFNAAVHYAVKPNLTIGALCDVVPKASSPKFNIATSYVCNPNTTVKVKVNSDGLINASVKQQLPKKFSVVAAAQFDTRNTSSINFGVTAALG